MHVTRQTPRREGFAPGASSIYWVIGGYIRARQKIAALREVQGADGIVRCGLALDPELVATEPLPAPGLPGLALSFRGGGSRGPAGRRGGGPWAVPPRCGRSLWS